MKYWITICLVVINTTIACASDESAFLNMNVVIQPMPHKVAVGYPHDMSENYYFVKSISRIFFIDEPVTAKVIEVDIDENKMRIVIENKKYGKGEITFYSRKNLEECSNDVLKTIINSSFSDDRLSKVVLDSDTKYFHIASSNHLPPEHNRSYLLKNDALVKGYKECGVCFHPNMYLPDLAVETALQKKISSELRYFNAPLLDLTMQSRVEKIGGKILKSWPYPLIGYSYRFTVVESNEINAYALPAGSIFITSSLIKALENDDELEAVVAHEIAHVERRHSLQTYKNLVANQQAQMALQVIGGIAVAAAGANHNHTAANVAAGVTLSSMLALNLQQAGYSKEQEQEADDFAVRYFVRANKDLKSLKSVFMKLMYHNLCSRDNPDPKSLTHPALGNRVLALDKQKHTFPSSLIYHFLRDDTPVQMQVLSFSEGDDESEIVLQVTDLPALRALMKEEGRIRFSSGEKIFEFKLDDKDVFIDAWGGIVTARSKSKGFTIHSTSGIEIEDFERDLSFGYPISRKWKMTKGSFY